MQMWQSYWLSDRTLFKQYSVSIEELLADTCRCPKEFDGLKTDTNAPEAKLQGQNATCSFKNIKFPRGNYEADSSET